MVKFSIVKPGTTFEVSHKSTTFIKNAAIPKVRIVIGRAISCKIGRIKALTIPIATAATTAAQIFVNLKPGTRYSTIRRANTFKASLKRSLIIYNDKNEILLSRGNVFFEKYQISFNDRLPSGI